MDSSPAAQNDKAQTNALRATCHTERVKRAKNPRFKGVNLHFKICDYFTLLRKVQYDKEFVIARICKA